jgi:hypothetical protein
MRTPFHEKWPWRRDAEGRTLLEVLPRWLRWIAGGALILLTVSCMMIRTAEDDPARWHVDPAIAERTGKPNDHLVAPPGTTRAAPDRNSPVWELDPEALIARLDAHARAQPRTIRLAGGPETAHATWVQRSAVWGFPDYVTAKAIPVEGGSALILWSRARYGHSDLGVNRKRVEAWLAAIAPGG